MHVAVVIRSSTEEINYCGRFIFIDVYFLFNKPSGVLFSRLLHNYPTALAVFSRITHELNFLLYPQTPN